MVGFENNQVSGDVPRQGPVAGFASQARAVVSDMLELAELQAKLAKADAVEATRAALFPSVMLVVGGCGSDRQPACHHPGTGQFA